MMMKVSNFLVLLPVLVAVAAFTSNAGGRLLDGWAITASSSFLADRGRELLSQATQIARVLQTTATVCLSTSLQDQARSIARNQAFDAAQSYLNLVYVPMQDGPSELTMKWLQVVQDSHALALYETAVGIFTGSNNDTCKTNETNVVFHTVATAQTVVDYATRLTSLLAARSQGLDLVKNDREIQAYYTLLDKLALWYCAMDDFVQTNNGYQLEASLPSFFELFHNDVAAMAAIAPQQEVDVGVLLNCTTTWNEANATVADGNGATSRSVAASTVGTAILAVVSWWEFV